MANMLRKKKGNAFGCCARCARKKKPGLKPGRRERHLARQAEKRWWKRDARDTA